MDKPYYLNKPIGSLSSLSRLLGLTELQLKKYSENIDSYYIANEPIIKPDGNIRLTYNTKPILRKIHTRILKQIFHRTFYPIYLQGSIKDKEQPRDYISNSSYHTHKQYIISEDVSNFFDSIHSTYVYKMWKYLYNFPDDVAATLTKLTTYKDFVAQGAITSSYIANLIFWDTEPDLVKQLNQRGFYYTRYVDDITLSAAKFIDTEDQTFATRLIYGMLFRHGVKPNRKKRKVFSNSKTMLVHNLITNSHKPTLSRSERNKIRAMVKQCEDMARIDSHSDDYVKCYNSALGKVGILSRLHRHQGLNFRKRLHVVKPNKT